MTNSTTHHIRRTLGGVAIAALLAGATITIAPQADGTIGFGGSVAEAAPGGNGKGKGNGAANGNGGNSANAGASVGAGANASSGSNGLGNAFGRSTTDIDSEIASAHPSELGRLNAAHASATARANAAPNSAVGQIASYERDVQEGNLESAAASFAEAANKDIVEPVVHAVNQLLGIDDAPVRDDEVADNDDGANDDDGTNDDGLDLGGLFEGLTVHDTEGEIAARANGTWNPREDGETGTTTQAHDS